MTAPVLACEPSAPFSYAEIAPLDWFQWRSLLWDYFPQASNAESASDWNAVANLVNASCPSSPPCWAADYERALRAVSHTVPAASSGMEIWTRSLYQQVPRLVGQQPPFMNLGYADESPSRIALEAADEPFRLNIQLYERAIGGRPLHGLAVLESGCGGGGGIRYLGNYHAPAHLAAVDLVRENVVASRALNAGSRWTFETADAARLPFSGDSFDAVISIESSGHYGDPRQFFREAARVLRAGGSLYLADLRPTGSLWGHGRNLAALRRDLQQACLHIVEESDLSEGVLLSIRRQEPSRRQFLDALALDPGTRAHFDEIMLMRGSRNCDFLAAGDLRYVSIVCKKPA
jgi:SAM-dependent methyltransferase